MSKLEVKFKYERETKNTVRFQEDVPETEPQVIGTLYVQKHAVAKLGNPKAITVTIDARSS